MGALRKAGVWLGLVEDDDELEYDDPAYDKSYPRLSRPRRTSAGSRRGPVARDAGRDRYADDFDDDDDDLDEALAAARSRLGDRTARLEAARESARAEATRLNVEARLEQARAERATVRPITRSASTATARAAGRTWRSRRSHSRCSGCRRRRRWPTTSAGRRSPPAPHHVQRGTADRGALPGRFSGDHEPHRDGRGGRQASGRLRRGTCLRSARYDRARYQPVFLALTGQRPGHRRGQGQDRRGRIPEPEPTRSMSPARTCRTDFRPTEGPRLSCFC